MFEDLIGMGRPLDLAPDFSEQHGYYTRGEPWRECGFYARRLPMVLKGHFNGTAFVADDPLPEGLAPNRPVEIRIVEQEEKDVFEEIAEMAVQTDLPSDYASQHEHYTKGTPRK